MKLFLCQECVGWVELRDNRCNECHQAIDVSAPDLPLWKLQAMIGQLAARLGEVRIQRRRLPSRGTLYATTDGLLFLPHRTEYVTQVIQAPGTVSLIWSLAGVIWYPLMLLSPMMRSKKAKEVTVEVARPQTLLTGEVDKLPECLMDSPGAFFVPLRSIRWIHRRRNTWRIDRTRGPLIKFVSETGKNGLVASIEQLSTVEPWNQIDIEL